MPSPGESVAFGTKVVAPEHGWEAVTLVRIGHVDDQRTEAILAVSKQKTYAERTARQQKLRHREQPFISRFRIVRTCPDPARSDLGLKGPTSDLAKAEMEAQFSRAMRAR